MLQEDGHAFFRGVCNDFTEASEEPIPDLLIVALERIVITLDAGPDDEVGSSVEELLIMPYSRMAPLSALPTLRR